ncbi:DEAD/DEAH box helicase [Rhizobium leguminosarum]|uniref:DEAD/DEAH box helicase n=1 Tax=Rhizobium leguminosarum TaxID=384 RepID=UPI001441BF1C|nr:AAA domain-containing protein [Rhizobium leguminosarum]MBY5868728.1 DNA helicase [Rhizobium leguminosarum]NKM07969.1 DNA helicase [Rhizobium leguminosarum bv. viciae]
MPPRPYLQKTIVELRALFEQSRGDNATLELLTYELSKRTVPKALALSTEIGEVLATLKAGKVAVVRTLKPDAIPSVEIHSSAVTFEIDSALADAPDPFEEVEVFPPFKPSGRKDDPAALLAAWTALEALSPQGYKRPEDLASGERSRIVQLSGPSLPWQRGLKAKPKHRLYFQVVLGCVALDRASDELVRVFGEDEERARPDGRKAVIGAVLVDKDGFLLDDNAVAVSSFAWAIRPALSQKLGHLGNWPRVQSNVLDKLDKIVRRKDVEGNPLPLDLATIAKAYEWLVGEFDIPRDLVEAPSFTLKIFHYFKSRTPPEPSLLNSFFLDDLTQASDLMKSGQLGTGLSRYLGISGPEQAVDVMAPASAVEPFVAPAMTQLARWPSSGGHPLVLLQQAAVNASRSELVGTAGIIGINGPPGTGKTTLLRDIVVGCVLDRATAMARFDKPADAFSTTGQKMGVGGNAFFHFYRLDPTLRGHEIVIASSNNKAVQNVSQELPLYKNNGRADEFSYLRSISDLVANPRRFGVEDDNAVETSDDKTWGLIAAVLGNGGNRAAFQQTFWWHEDGGFRIYLKAAKGDDVLREITDPETGKVTRREIPSVVTKESPPVDEMTALANWRKARNRFVSMRKQITQELGRIEAVRQCCVELPAVRLKLNEAAARRGPLAASLLDVQKDLAEREQNMQLASSQFVDARRDVDDHLRRRPGFFARLFRSAVWKNWERARANLDARVLICRQALATTTALRGKSETAVSDIQNSLVRLEGEIEGLKSNVASKEQAIGAARAELGDRVIDQAFFKRSHEAINLTTPWLPDGLHRKREDLFAAALNVHKAFVDASAQKVLHNLNILMSAFTVGALSNPLQKALLGDLWSTLFMVVPSISTTFASVSRMFGDLGPESIGWLLIDEAGQALPQAAVGAIMRSKRSIVVGDPLQIPPVVSLPERLNSEICKFFDVDQNRWSAPLASAQTLADRSSRFQSTFRSDAGPRSVGFPLLVHRRCQNPMFSVSNTIAYDGQMVHAAPPPVPGIIGEAFGPSCWFDIDAEADTKWSPGEGEIIVRMLRRIAALRVISPDLFIITPFKIVETEMRRRLERERDIFKAIGEDADDWGRNRVGTVHTFQGREAETVILLLGAPRPGQHRARVWAGNPPNILNVAISRAKQNFYVVGSKSAWSGAGQSFQTLMRTLQTRQI